MPAAKKEGHSRRGLFGTIVDRLEEALPPEAETAKWAVSI